MRAVALCLAVMLPILGCSKTTVSTNAMRTSGPGESSKTCLLCPEPLPPNCTICATSNPILNVNKDGAGSSMLRLCNRGAESTALDLRLSDFHAPGRDGATYPLSSQASLSAVPSNNPVVAGTAPLGANACVDIKLDVTGLWQAGFYSAQLRNGDTAIASIKALRYQVPFNIRADGPTPEAVSVEMTRGSLARIRLRNDDDMKYRFVWTLDLGGDEYTNTAEIGARGRTTLSFEPKADGFNVFESGFLRSGAKSGMLTLAFEPDTSVRELPVPQKRYPVTARVNYYSPDTQRIVNWVAILVVLLVGIAISFLVSYVLPTQKKRVDIKQRLADLEGRLAGVGDVIDSRILSLLRVEKNRLRAEIDELLPIFPQSAIELPKLNDRIDWLGKRIELTLRAADLLESVSTAEATLAFPEADAIRAHCREIADVVRKASPAAGDFAQAEDQLRLAEAIVEQADTDPPEELVTKLTERAGHARQAIPSVVADGSGWKVCEDVLRKLTELPNLPPTVTRPDYVRLARRVCQAELLVQYAELVESSADACMRKRRLARAEDLLRALKDGPDQSHERARDIVYQVEQNVSREDLIAEMSRMKESNPQADKSEHAPLITPLRVELDPPRPLAYQLVTFRVRFQRPGLDSAIAQDEIPCVWYVDGQEIEERVLATEKCVHGPDGHHARGWLVGHFFGEKPTNWRTMRARTPGRARTAPRLKDHEVSHGRPTYEVSVHFPDTGLTLSRRVTLERTKDYVESRSMLALASLGITLLIVAFGLLAGAQERLQSLDWLSGTLAVLILGFGADTLKTLISRT